MRVTVLASGSSGNATLFETNQGSVLVDAGIPVSVLVQRMRAARCASPDAVVITHAHGDHHRYAVEIGLHFNVPIWVSDATRPMLSLRSAPTVRVYGTREPFRIRGVAVRPFLLPHDAVQVSLRLEEPAGPSAIIATDLGTVPAGLASHVEGCDVVLIESNHDPDMLWRGPYSASLKRRIASDRGHLSNQQTATFLEKLDRAVRTVVLMHLSETNNRPELARAVAAEALADHTAQLLVASQHRPLTVDLDPPRQLELFSACSRNVDLTETCARAQNEVS
jgi:phosphoribosyl 1,2-cyclic phosphodiesterase